MSKGGKYLKQAAPVQKKKKSPATVILIILIVIALLAVIVIGAGILFYNSKLNKITRPDVEIKNPSQEEIDNIMTFVPEDSVIYDAPVFVLMRTGLSQSPNAMYMIPTSLGEPLGRALVFE